MIGAKKSWHCQTTSRRRCQWHHRCSRYRFQDQHQLLLLLLLDHWIHHSMDLIQWCDQNGNLRMCHTQKGETGNISCIILKNILVISVFKNFCYHYGIRISFREWSTIFCTPSKMFFFTIFNQMIVPIDHWLLTWKIIQDCSAPWPSLLLILIAIKVNFKCFFNCENSFKDSLKMREKKFQLSIVLLADFYSPSKKFRHLLTYIPRYYEL